jgi:hypothetical protein
MKINSRLLSALVVKSENAHTLSFYELQKQIEKEFGNDWRENLKAKQAFYQGHFDAHKLKVKVEINYDRNEMRIIPDNIDVSEKINVANRWNKFKKMKPVNLNSRQRDRNKT